MDRRNELSLNNLNSFHSNLNLYFFVFRFTSNRHKIEPSFSLKFVKNFCNSLLENYCYNICMTRDVIYIGMCDIFFVRMRRFYIFWVRWIFYG